MAQYYEKIFMCRVERNVRVMKNVIDNRPSPLVVDSGSRFTSRKQYQSGKITLYHISETEDDFSRGYWCPSDAITSIEIEEAVKVDVVDIAADGSIGTEDSISISANNAIVYVSADTGTTVTHTLMPGDVVYIDRKRTHVNVGVPEVRYHISRVADGVDSTIVDMWIVHNEAVTLTSINSRVTKIKQRIPTPRIPPSKGKVEPVVNIEEEDSVLMVAGAVAGVVLSTSLLNKFDETEDNVISNGTVSTAILSAETLSNMLDLYKTEYSLMGAPIGKMVFVHGMPFQYTHITDRREGEQWDGRGNGEYATDGKATGEDGEDAYGRSFAANVACNMPIAVLVPGVPSFLDNVGSSITAMFSLSSTKTLFSGLWADDSDFDNIIDSLDDVAAGDYQYYSMTIDTAGYFMYVNSLCWASALMLGLKGTEYRGVDCSKFNWNDFNTAADQDYAIYQQVVGFNAGVSFAFDPMSSISDSISNSTTESVLTSTFNTVSSLSREVEFITGLSGMGLTDTLGITSSDYMNASTASAANDTGLVTAIARGSSWFNNAAFNGMNVRFPELWADSSYGKSYSIDMHFIAPYADNFTKWRYALVPFFHIFALAAPMTSDESITQYSRPFLIKAYSKGYFNVEMGIIESITWKKFGDGDMISANGVPTQIDVSITFKDLYQQLAMSATSLFNSDLSLNNPVTSMFGFYNNTGLMDLIGTLSGVNMNKITIDERIALFVGSMGSMLSSGFDNYMSVISNKLTNIAYKWLCS